MILWLIFLLKRFTQDSRFILTQLFSAYHEFLKSGLYLRFLEIQSKINLNSSNKLWRDHDGNDNALPLNTRPVGMAVMDDQIMSK